MINIFNVLCRCYCGSILYMYIFSYIVPLIQVNSNIMQITPAISFLYILHDMEVAYVKFELHILR